LNTSAVGGPIWFFIVAGLMGWKGELIRPFVEKYFKLSSFAFEELIDWWIVCDRIAELRPPVILGANIGLSL